ncbi:MAG: YfhO family protein [Bacilli bacterium]
MLSRIKEFLKKKSVQNTFAVLFFILSFLGIYFIVTKGKFIWGSNLDWSSQHYLIPEYFRNLFYETHDLIPDFAFNLGGGQNIFYLSYYGFLSPFILFSYLLPFIEMIDYIQIISCVIPIVSAVLMYFYLRRKHSFCVSFLVSFMFMCAAPFLFHSHRHIMFVSYMPFLVMGMFGIDRFFDKNKWGLLIVSVFLIIMTSYYYAVGSLVALFIYGIYYYLKSKKEFKLKKCFIFTLPFIIGVLMSMVLLLPTIFALFNGRIPGNSPIKLIDLLMPQRDFQFIIYNTYSIGLSIISLIGVIYLTFTKKPENIFLGLIILLCSIFPLFNYILNGTLYIDGKSLIPFLPIIMVFVASFVDLLLKRNINYKKISIILLFIFLFSNSKLILAPLGIIVVFFIINKFTKKSWAACSYIICSSFILCTCLNFVDNLVPKEYYKSNNYENIDDVIGDILKNDDGVYRISNLFDADTTLNKVSNMGELKTSIYSSAFNREFNKFYFDIINNQVSYRNKSITPESEYFLYQMLMGDKYTVTDGKKPLNSELIKTEGNLKVYKNNFVLPIGYSNSNIINYNDFLDISYPSNVLNMVNNIVVKNHESNNEIMKLDKYTPKFDVVDNGGIDLEKTSNGYNIKADKRSKMVLKLDHLLDNEVMYIRFKVNNNPSCSEPDIYISINGVRNKLTCKTWKYHNQNFVFDYAIHDVEKIDIEFEKGIYELSDFEYYLLDTKKINKVSENIDEFVFDKNLTKGDKIVGDIDVLKDGYFTFSIPYDKGFNIKLDGKEIDYEEVNTSFIGFPIKSGKHHIEMSFVAPFKKEGIILSLVGIFSLIIVLIVERRRSK